MSALLRDESDRPNDVNRTSLIRARARMLAAGVETWDLPHSRASLNTLASHTTVRPVGIEPASVAALDMLSKPAAAPATVGSQLLASSLALSQTVNARPDVPYHGRNNGFSSEHYRGLERGGK